ncbi:MAG: FAD-dependent oxidoreductase, partial [Caldilineaceae bacterium]|nr:FAD-dependent oxidoreductase [Caldilineaceae bacterium]
MVSLQLGGLGSQPEAYDVIIIGGGPAGASAAIYTARADLRTLVIDKGLTAGALGLTEKISNYPGVPGPISGAELAETMRRQAESFGAEFITDKVVGVDLQSNPKIGVSHSFGIAEKDQIDRPAQLQTCGTHPLKIVMAGTGSFHTRALILATGSMGRTNTVPGEEALLGRGVSYCATCDGAFFREQRVAVIGNTDEALEETLFLAKFVESVDLIVPTPALKARPGLAAEVTEHPKVTLRLGTRLREIIGNGHVDGVRVQPRTGDEAVLPVKGAFVYLQGAKPITDYLGGQLATNEEGCLTVDHDLQTAIPGVFAVGDLL